MTPLMRLSGVSVDLHGSPVLRDLNWELRAGECWMVTGPNGAGKSTFFRLLRGDIWPSRGERRYALGGNVTRSPLLARERVALVSPELHDWYARSEWSLTAWQVVLSGTGGGHLPPYPLMTDHEARAREAVTRLQVEHLLERDVRALSQGQRRQVLLARALAGRPALLVLDEFWEGVDARSRARLRELVEHLVRDGLTVLYSSHRASDFLEGTTHHLRLDGGRIAAAGSRLEAPRAARAAPTVISGAPGEVVLEVRDAHVYRADTPALRGVSWQLRAGEHWVFLGANGAGKSTLGRLIAGELPAAVGAQVRRFDLSARATLEERRRVIGVVSAEEQVRHRRDVTGEVIVSSGFFGTVGLAGGLSAEQHERLFRVAAQLDVADLLTRSAAELSHGQLKKLLFARALVSDARLLVLDEPFDYLDEAFKARLLATLEERAAGGTQFVFVVHRVEDLPAFVTRALQLDGGRVVFQGALAELPRDALPA